MGTQGDRIIKKLQQMSSIVCSLATDNTLCPEQGGIAYQDIPHYQTTVYRDGDEGYRVVNGLMDQNNPAFPLYTQKLDLASADPFNTLFYNNAFGTRDRFTDIDGLQVYGDGIVVDHLTKRMYSVLITAGIDWANTIDAAEASVIGGFSDWHLSTVHEQFFVIDHSKSPTFTFGSIGFSFSTHTSTTRNESTTNMIGVSAISQKAALSAAKTITRTNHIIVRILDESDLNIP